METNLLDILWIIVASCLVFIMQAGFAMVESGLTRSKNSINVAIKNLTDLGVSTIFFWIVGFGLMFGSSFKGYVGNSFFLFKAENTWIAAFFLFQAMFCSTSATIVSGAIAERVKYGAYIVATIFLSAVIYPVFGHWVWGGIVPGTGQGWLASLGFVDFAGSTVVHSLGGWVSLAFLLIVGQRSGRFKNDGEIVEISGSNIPMVVLGVLILWFGWFGFNGGSTLSMNNSVASIILKTTLSASAGMICTLAIGWPMLKKPDVTLVMNGALAGLVAITAPVHAVTELQSIIIGAVGGAFMLISSFGLNKLKIDDAVGAIPVHLVAGIWGTLAVGLFGDLSILDTGLSRINQIIIQGAGVLSCGVWAFGLSFIFLKILNAFYPLRIGLKEEIDGLNKSEHGASTEIFDLYTVLHHQASTGDITERAPVEPFTEVGQIAQIYNEVLDKLEENTVEKSDYLNILENVSDGMFLLNNKGEIGKHYSKSLESILEMDQLGGKQLYEILKSYMLDSNMDDLKDFISLAFDVNTRWRHVDRVNPLREIDLYINRGSGDFKTKHLEFDFKRIEKGGEILNLLVLIRDVTDEYELNLEIEKTREKSHVEMELLYKILHVEPNILREFFSYAKKDLVTMNNIFQDSEKSSRERLEQAFRISHGLKGDAELLNLFFISEKAEEIEIMMQKMIKDEFINRDDFIPLTLKFGEIQNTFDKIESLLDKWAGFKIGSGNEKLDKSRYFKDHLVKMTNRLAEKYNKSVNINLEKLSLEKLDESQTKPVQDILVQLLRNSVYHGIESSDTRVNLGKKDTGNISIRMEESEDTLHIVFSDDGAGLNLSKIRDKALLEKIITKEQYDKLSDNIIPRLIFKQGLSTAGGSDSVAGKGVGMPLVNNLIEKLDGSIGIRTKSNVGCQFILKIPIVKNSILRQV